MKIHLTSYNEQTEIDWSAVPTATVPTVVPHTVPTESKAVPTEKFVGGKFDKYHKEYPEEVKVCFKRGAKEYLKQESRSRGFSSVSTMIRSAIKFAIQHPEFRNGWDK